ncbi:tRNA (cmo5U34)-methyltransferase [Candidatus Hepatincola sp. Pdp]
MENCYWDNYYEQNRLVLKESSFAKYTMDKFLEPERKIIDLGCGNGRDSIFFYNNALKVTGVDFAQKEIEFLTNYYQENKGINFIFADMSNMPDIVDAPFDYAYFRFSLHAIKIEAQQRVLNWVKNNLLDNGLLLIEARSDKDPMFLKGKQISKNENITDHYRRYLNLQDTLTQIKNLGFTIIEAEEANNLSVYGNDNPFLIRIVAKLSAK